MRSLLSKIWTFFVLTLFVQSCSCNWHIKKAQQKCGLKSDTDTVYVTVRDSIPEIAAGGSLSIEKQDSALIAKTDSLFDSINTKYTYCDSVVRALKAQIRHLIKNRAIVPDDKVIYTHGGYIKAWMGKNGFEFQVNIPKQVIERKVPVLVTNNEYKESIKWHHWLGWILFVVLLVSAIMFKRRLS